MRIAVLGAAGQLGRDLCPLLDGEVFPLPRAEADLTIPESLATSFASLKPDLVINCGAYNLVDRAENDPEAAFGINAWGVRNLAQICARRDCALLQVSTDYVFGLETNRARPYAEEEAPGPVNVYGLSKLAGEYFVRALVPRHWVVRTCGLYGRHGVGGKGGNFVETMLRLAREGKSLRVVADQHLAPTATADLAHALAELVQTEAFGLYHLTNSGECTWFEFARRIFNLAGLKADLQPTTSQEYGAPARRPAYSVLENRAWARLGRPILRSWEEALADYLRKTGETPMS